MAGQCLFLYYDWITAFEALSPAELGRLTMCALKYSAYGEESELTGNERFTWPLIKSQIDRDNARYEEISKKRREAGALSHSKSNQKVANDSKWYQGKKEPKKSNNNINNKPSNSFTPPTLDEVREYARERNSKVDPDQFFAYFSEGNWVDAKGQKVRAWKQKFLTWEKMQADRSAPAPSKPKQYVTAAEYKNPSTSINVDMIRKLDEQMAAWKGA